MAVAHCGNAPGLGAHPMKRLLGSEIEYGMFIEGKDPSEHEEQAAALVRSYAGVVATSWDYRMEDPRRDARGFHVDRLASNPADARYDRAPSAQRPPTELRSDRVLVNGARLYNDHGHPEYATPECLSPRELVTHECAGEQIVLACARAYAEAAGVPVRLYKNNTDFHGMSYGAHESYLMARSVPFQQIVSALLPFFVTRPIYAGAGKVGVEPHGPAIFQLSQRADFFTEDVSVDTLHRRPIINSRDEPHADPRLHRRLHVICGDANMSPYAAWLKTGATALVLGLVERGWQPPYGVRRPVEALRRLSRDQSLRWPVESTDGREVPAVEIQRLYLDAVVSAGLAGDAEYAEVAAEWARVLDTLESDPLSLADCLDWAAKRQLLETFREAEGLSWNDDTLRSLDLEYHNVDPEAGLYHALAAEGAMRTLVSQEEVAGAMECPPAETRAAVRGACVRRFAPDIRAVTWSRLVIGSGNDAISIDLADLVDGRAAGMAAAVERIGSAAELVRMVEEH